MEATVQSLPSTQPAGGNLNSQSLLGSRLSIISTVQARYEGILSEVDPVAKTMRLKNVKNCGTEGRRAGVNEIQASEMEIQEVLFKIEHIKDFKILERPNTILLDPAIVSTSNTSTEAQPAKKEGEHKSSFNKEERGFYQNFPKHSFP